MNKIGILLVIASVVSTAVLSIADVNLSFEPPFLLPVSNTLFTAVIPVTIAFLAARIFVKNGSSSIFLMGCGMLSFGVSAAVAGWLRPAQNGANLNVTIYNTGAMLGALFHIAGALLSSAGKTRWQSVRSKLVMSSAYSAIFAFIVLFTYATLEGVIPPFFIQERGPTALRQIVLGLSIFFYLLSAIFFMDHYLKTKSAFFYWYSLGLAMMACGLFAFYIQKVVGSPIGWAGRITNYIGSVFALAAVWTAVLRSRSKGQAVEDVISSFFMEAEASFRSLFEAAADAIISCDREDRIILWNSGAERIFGYTKEEAVGTSFTGTLIPGKHLQIVKRLIADRNDRNDGPNLRSTAEIEVRLKDGTHLPVEISAFARELPVGWISTCIIHDITVRKQAEKALQESEERYRSLFENLNSAALLIEPIFDKSGKLADLRYLMANPAVSRHLRKDASDLIGRLCSEVFPYPGRNPVFDIYEKVLHTGQPYTGETLLPALKTYYDLSVYRPSDGRLALILSDVSERKWVQQRLEDDLAALTRMHTLSGKLLAAEGIQPLLQEVTDAAVEILKADYGTLQLIENDSLRIVAHHGHREPFLDFFASAENRASACGAALMFGKRVIVPDVEESELFTGTPSLLILREAGVRAVQSTPLVSRSGEILGILTTQWSIPHTPSGSGLWRIDLLSRQAADLIQYVRTEETLRADLEVMSRLQKLGSLYLQGGNLEAVLTEIVDAAIAISGADFGNIQLIDPQTHDLRVVAQRGFPQWWLDFWNQVSEGRGACGTAFKSGKRIVVENVEQDPIFIGTEALEIQLRAGVRAVQSTPLVSRLGKPLGMFSTHYKAPHRLDEHSARLLDLLARHAADIIDRAQTEDEIKRHSVALEEANKELESFSYSVSHDLRTPLRTIDGFSSLLLRKHGRELDDDSLRKFNVIRSNVQMMGRLIDDILTLSRLGRKEMSCAQIEMAALIDDLWKELQIATKDSDIRLTVDAMPTGYGDITLIRQIWINLLANAIKFAKRSNPTLITAGGYVNGNEHIYFVKDNGIGFDMAYHDKLFHVFQRLHSDAEYEGTGVGLAIVHRIAHRHGGRVWAEGREGEGATFYFSLPLSS